jgi:hypothetical protein
MLGSNIRPESPSAPAFQVGSKSVVSGMEEKKRNSTDKDALERQSKVLDEVGEILEADLVNGENLKKAVEEHSKACDEVKMELEKHKGHKPFLAPE